MPGCNLCKQNKPDVQVRPLLRVVDAFGQRSRDPIPGMLCDSWLRKSSAGRKPGASVSVDEVNSGSPRGRLRPRLQRHS
jgi:hypothetical protein